MKTLIQIVFFISFVFVAQAQNSKSYTLIRSNLGASGSSKVVNTNRGKYIVSQSIGQSSVIGTSFNNGYYLRQGYQQPLNKIKVDNEGFSNNDLTATVYPNPFNETLTVSFNEEMNKEISVLVFDITGKLIYNQKFSPSQRIELNLNNISSGSYLLKVLSNNKLLNTKIIKK